MPTEDFYVLCVDDEGALRDALSETVRAQGLIPLLASSGSEAQGILGQHSRRICLVLSDYQMPDMNGLELRRTMLDEHKQIPFVIVSGQISREDALRGIELKISGFVEKPFSIETISQAIRTHSAERITWIRDEIGMIEGFVADAESLLEEMETLLLALESNPSDLETINRIFAIAHTIKGASGFFRPNTIHRFTHAYEDFLSPYKKRAQAVPPEAISVLLRGLDVLKSLLPSLVTGQAGPVPLEELLQIFQKQPTGEAAASAEAGPAAAPSSAPRDEIKVPIPALDEFMEMSGEITVIRNMINKIAKAVEKDVPGNRNVSLLTELLEEMHKINSLMQEKVVDLRKVGFKDILRPLKRAVRDLAGILKKDVQLLTQGEDLRVDTAIAEILGNSLIHMVRNSTDHGIESPEQRKASGKPAQGTISVEAKEQNQEVVIVLRDDGKGIDPEAIRRKIVEKELVAPEAAAAMSVPDLHFMIFESGFSTAAQVTDVSGRGVGMDMVKKAVTGGGGKIEIESEVGKGSTFRITIPIPKMVTIINALLVRGGTDLIAIPQESLLRLLSLSPAASSQAVRRMEGADFLELEEELFPILNLEAALKEGGEDRFRAPTGRDGLQFVLVGCEDGRFALAVDEIYDTEDTVVKKLGPHLQNISLFRGATFLGDGGVGLILDVQGLARHSGVFRQNTATPGASAEAPAAVASAETGHETRSLLLVKLEHSGTFGFFLDDIFRLENIPSSWLQRSGDVKIIIYRQRTCPFFSADELLGYESSQEQLHSGEIPTIILRQGESYLGISVREIVDLVSTSQTPDSLLADRAGIAGALIHQESTVTLLDVGSLFILAHARTHPTELAPLIVDVARD